MAKREKHVESPVDLEGDVDAGGGGGGEQPTAKSSAARLLQIEAEMARIDPGAPLRVIAEKKARWQAGVEVVRKSWINEAAALDAELTAARKDSDKMEDAIAALRKEKAEIVAAGV